MSPLHHLPAEIIGEILGLLDPASFYQCLQTCRLFREHASASTKLLSDQLARIPCRRTAGGRPGGSDVDLKQVAIELRRTFCKSATQHLAYGVEWMTDRELWRSHKHADRKKSTLLRWTEDAWLGGGYRHPFLNRLVLIEVFSGLATVNIHLCAKENAPRSRPRLKHIISPHGLSEHLPVCTEHATQYEVLKAVQCRLSARDQDQHCHPMLGVLYQPKSPTCECLKFGCKLLVFRLDSSFGPIVVESFDIEGLKDVEVVAMAMTRSNEAIIVVRYGLLELERVLVYRIEDDDATFEKRTTQEYHMDMPITPYARERVSGILIRGRTNHLYPSSFPMPHWSVWLSPLSNAVGESIEPRDTILPDIIKLFPRPSLGHALERHHHHGIQDPTLNDGQPSCVNTALEFAISRDSSQPGTRTGAFLLKALHYPSTCKTFNLTKDYLNLYHVYVAELSGIPDLHNLSSLGLRIAFSPNNCRIAIASWKTVKVWALDAQAFLDPNYGLAGGQGVPGDYAYIEGCGWEYYNNCEIDRDCVILEPVELPSQGGVLYDLAFRKDDELWGRTEEGIVRWKFGPGAKGKVDVSDMGQFEL